MDVTALLASHSEKQYAYSLLTHSLLMHTRQGLSVIKDTPLEVDAGYLTVLDPNPIDEENYKLDLLTSISHMRLILILGKILKNTCNP